MSVLIPLVLRLHTFLANSAPQLRPLRYAVGHVDVASVHRTYVVPLWYNAE